MYEQHLQELVEHWRALSAEAKQQGEDAHQSSLLRGHAFGVCDGLEIAAGDLEKLIKGHAEIEESSSA
jgi:hypothetical protein